MHVSQPAGSESQLAPGVPCRVHRAPVVRTMGHDMLGHAGPALLQVTSHRHDTAQSIDGQAAGPEQAMSHAARPQLMRPHAEPPEQSMSQLCARAQSMLPQLPAVHRIVQSNPGGQDTSPQTWLELHSIRQVRSSRSQDVHGLGHWLDASTQ
jgi:hypothetical protein